MIELLFGVSASIAGASTGLLIGGRIRENHIKYALTVDTVSVVIMLLCMRVLDISYLGLGVSMAVGIFAFSTARIRI